MGKKQKSPEKEIKEELPFANAEVVRLMRKHLPKDRMIKKRVKIGMNKFLGEIGADVTKKLAKEPFAYIEYDMFRRAIQQYTDLKKLEVEKQRLIKSLEKIKADCDVMIADVERTFSLFAEEKDEDY